MNTLWQLCSGGIIHIYSKLFMFMSHKDSSGVEEDTHCCILMLHCDYKILEGLSISCLPVFQYWQNNSGQQGVCLETQLLLRTDIIKWLLTNRAQKSGDLQSNLVTVGFLFPVHKHTCKICSDTSPKTCIKRTLILYVCKSADLKRQYTYR